MSNQVRRIFSEKKKEFAVEAAGLMKDVKSDVGVKTIESVRIFHRYDVSGLTDEEYELAKNVVFSEPPVDDVYDETIDTSGSAYVLAIESLPGVLREPTVLYYFDGFNVPDIASMTALPEGTVYYRLHQARTLLREKLAPRFREEGASNGMEREMP